MENCMSFLQPLNQVLMTKCLRREKKKNVDKTPLKQKICYGVGHVFNDLCIQAWFSYIIIYFTKVIKLSSTNVGYIFLVSQIADAVSTPFIGYACDKQISNRVGKRYGNRKIWHLFGSAGMALVWPFLYSRCLLCDEGVEEWVVVTYYGILTAAFSFFWPMVEISHLSLMPHVARRGKDALELGAIRSAFKLGCGVYIYVITWILLGQDSNEKIDENTQKPFTYQTIIVIITGGFFAALFHWGVDEVGRNRPKKKDQEVPSLQNSSSRPSTTNDPEKLALQSEEQHLEIVELDKNKATPKTWRQWLKTPDLYFMMLIYMITQNVINLFQSYFPLYLYQAMGFQKEAIAYFPLIVLVSGIIASFTVKHLNKKFSNRILYCTACILTIGSAAWFFFTPKDSKNTLYAPTVTMGCGMSVMVVTSLALVADLIGDDKHSSGMIYSAMAFVDKLSLGLIILGLQETYPKGQEDNANCPPCTDHVKLSLAVIPGIEALIGFVLVAFFFQRRPFQGLKKNKEKSNENSQPLAEQYQDEQYDESHLRKIESLKSTDV